MPDELTILGVHVKSQGYPNVRFRVRALTESTEFNVTEINFPFQRADRGGGLSTHAAGIGRMFSTGLRLITAHLRLLIAYLCRRAPVVYVPYPAVGVLFGLSILPRRWRPRRLIADCFISYYDTIVEDRLLLSASGILARLLRRIEARAYGTADIVIVDTALNASYFGRTFGLESKQVVALPLAIDEINYQFAPYTPSGSGCTVLFVGTFVPLQGVDVIAKAAVLLRDEPGITFRLIGSGQASADVERILDSTNTDNVTWLTEWMDGAQLAQEIRNADICLGIFGTSEKAQRVWPLKNYSYMAVGRAIITANSTCARDLFTHCETSPALLAPPGDAQFLANAILTLARDATRRSTYARAARACFDTQLGSNIAKNRLFALIRERNDPQRTSDRDVETGRSR